MLVLVRGSILTIWVISCYNCHSIIQAHGLKSEKQFQWALDLYRMADMSTTVALNDSVPLPFIHLVGITNHNSTPIVELHTPTPLQLLHDPCLYCSFGARK